MSDIKYIIAGDDNGEHTRFPCLAVVRYAAATVVTVLALAVIAMVIHAVLRSEDIRLSVNDGFIGADNLYSQTRYYGLGKATTTSSVGGGRRKDTATQRPADTASSSSVAAVRRPSQTPDSLHVVGKSRAPRTYSTHSSSFDGGLGGDGDHDFTTAPKMGTNYGNHGATNVTLQRANTTHLRVILIANNPGGRTKINCTDTTVTLTDTQYPSYEIGTLQLGNFIVPPQTTITLQRRMNITDPATLSYIWEHHGGADYFGVMVRVNASVTSYPLGKAQTKRQSYVCQLVTVGLLDDEWLLATDDVECQLCSKLLDNTATSAC